MLKVNRPWDIRHRTLEASFQQRIFNSVISTTCFQRHAFNDLLLAKTFCVGHAQCKLLVVLQSIRTTFHPTSTLLHAVIKDFVELARVSNLLTVGRTIHRQS